MLLLSTDGAKAGAIDWESIKRAGRDAAIAAAIMGIGKLTESLSALDFGTWSPIIVPALMGAFSLARRWLTDYSQKSTPQ